MKLCPVLICLSLHPFVFEAAISALSKALLCICKLSIVWRIEVAETQVQGLCFLILMRCQQRLSFVSMFILIEISLSCPFSCVIMNNCIHGYNYFVYMIKFNMLD